MLGTAIVTVLAAVVITWEASLCQTALQECQDSQGTHPLANPTAPVAGSDDHGGNQSKDKSNWACNRADNYFCRVLTPANLPTIYLVLVGVGGIVIAVGSLQIIQRQTEAMESQTSSLTNIERAWLLPNGFVDPLELPKIRQSPIQEEQFAINIKNFGRTPAFLVEWICKLSSPKKQTLQDF